MEKPAAAVLSSVSVAVIAGSKSDQAIVDDVTKALDDLHVPYETRFLSAHRNPVGLREYVQASTARVFIAIAGLSAHLPGTIAAITTAPVIGVPVAVKLNGLDSLLSIAQMPPGVPAACVGIDSGKNAAILAAEILAVSDAALRSRLEAMRRAWA